jgi:uncharacterized Zn-binding protein involved in type VI secretion
MLKSFITFVLIYVLSCPAALAHNSSNEESAQDSFPTLANQPNSISKTSAAPSFGASEYDNTQVTIVAPEPNVEFSLSSPVGSSPKVFTEGWSFTARCLVNGKDLSDQITWSGTGVFQPKKGRTSYPIFQKEGSNTITLTIFAEDQTKSRNYHVLAVSPSNYAHIGSVAFCPSDAHAPCPACPHPVKGPITSGSSKVLINKLGAARVGDVGTHAACCGSNTFTIATGDPQVLIEGRPAARIGDKTKHCGGMGHIVADGNRSIVGAWTYFITFSLSGGMPTIKQKYPATFYSNGTFGLDGKPSTSGWTLTGDTLKIANTDKVRQYKLSADGNTLTDLQTGELRMQRGSPKK